MKIKRDVIQRRQAVEKRLANLAAAKMPKIEQEPAKAKKAKKEQKIEQVEQIEGQLTVEDLPEGDIDIMTL